MDVLSDGGIDDARRNAEWLIEKALGFRRAHLFAYPNEPVSETQAAALDAMLMRRLRHEPVQYIVDEAEFFGLRLHVTPAVLIPRPETEQVVEVALTLIAPVGRPRVLDVGTGSGCIPLAVQHERPEAEVHACDVSEAALEVATSNAVKLGLDVSFFRADVLADDFPQRTPPGLELLISNPPYVPRAEAPTLEPEVRDFEPGIALFVEDDPLQFYRALARHALVVLAPGGHVVVETHADFGSAVAHLFARSGLTAVRLLHDLADRPRIVTARRPALKERDEGGVFGHHRAVAADLAQPHLLDRAR